MTKMESGRPAGNFGPLMGEAPEDARPLKQRIFDLVRASGPVSRAQVAKELRISRGTVSVLTADLIEARLLCEDQTLPASAEMTRGRPPVGLSVRADAFVVAGIKLSSGNRTGLLIDSAGNRLASYRMPVTTRDRSTDSEIDATGMIVDTMLADQGLSRCDLAAVGLGLPGFVNNETGSVHWSPLFTQGDPQFARRASDRLGLPVAIDNDANLVALAELWFGKGRRTADFVVVTLEEGVGMGTVLNHRLFRGANNLGGELGHLKVALDGALCRCGQRGCLEAYLSDYAIVREGATALPHGIDRSAPRAQRIEALQQAAAQGNAAAQSIFNRAQRYLAFGVANVVNLMDPSLVILSGGQMRYDWLDPEVLRRDMREFVIGTDRDLPQLKVHEWGDLLWAHGAAALALEAVTEARLGPAAVTA
ncbi:ROK family protein [Salipiger sp. IMCC34102]|uniref:ROK family protein n=1 Tax=Salipiger sp. IMCC34102 TaxID=2510647 RepID=UPI00101C30C7|nr:ROK family protein [Salipiger sp. IMCC34102]RYH00782.1 ROK family protein [Salipiger sp. IMCC34102]